MASQPAGSKRERGLEGKERERKTERSVEGREENVCQMNHVRRKRDRGGERGEGDPREEQPERDGRGGGKEVAGEDEGG